jgi:hypothetical protein
MMLGFTAIHSQQMEQFEKTSMQQIIVNEI